MQSPQTVPTTSQYLTLRVHSANDLKKPRFCLLRPRSYFRVSMADNNLKSSLRSTTDRTHGLNPVWDFNFKIDLQQGYPLGAVVKFDIMHASALIDMKIGELMVPIRHFVDGDGGGKPQRFSYGIRLPSGETRGKLIISHQKVIINNPTTPDEDDGELQAYLPTLEFPNHMPTRPSQSSSSPSDVIGMISSCLGICAHAQDIASGI